MKGEERSEVPTRHAYACPAQSYLVLLGIFSLLTGTGIGIWFLEPLNSRPTSAERLPKKESPLHSGAAFSTVEQFLHKTSAESLPTSGLCAPPGLRGCSNKVQKCYRGSRARPKKNLWKCQWKERINRSNFLLEVQVEGRSNRLLLCHENWGSSLGTIICRQLGHIRLTHHKGVNLTDVKVSANQEFLQVSPHWKENANERWQIRKRCPSGRIVALKCSECGTTHSKTVEITGGKNVSLAPWPWQVGLYRNGKRVCAGALLSHEWIISAAHCMDSSLHLSNWVALVGLDVHARIKDDSGLAMEKVVLHPSYNHASHDYDLAMLKLKETLSFSDTIQAVCLPLYHQDLPNSSTCWIAGQDYPRPENATVLIAETWAEAPVALNSPKNCNSSCGYASEITDRILCAHYLDGTINACKGESGGALVCQHERTQHLVGIRSWDSGCKQPDQPGVYTKVVELLDWIHRVMEGNEE